MLTSTPPAPMIELNNLDYRWADHLPSTITIDQLSIAPNERVFIKGPSGCGKSTLLGLLTGIITPQKGELKVLGQDLASLKQSERDKFRADHIGYIFQQFNLLPYLSVIDNVLLPCHFSSSRKAKVEGDLIEQAKHLLGRLHLPSALLNSPVTDLSIGQQQRVAAARALIGHPELLIADEPTSALDHDNRAAFIELLMEEAQQTNTSLVFVSHDPTLEIFFDRSIDLTQLNKAMEESA